MDRLRAYFVPQVVCVIWCHEYARNGEGMKGPLKLIHRVTIAHLFLRDMSKLSFRQFKLFYVAPHFQNFSHLDYKVL